MYKVQDNNIGARISVKDIVIKKPSECSKNELTAFEALVKKGKEVKSQTLPDLIRKAWRLAFYYKSNELVAIGAMKQPTKQYRNRIFEKSGSKESPEGFNFELGWLYTEPDFRKQGISKDIVSKLLAVLPKEAIYATTRYDYIVSFLKQFDFIKSGSWYKSKRGNYKLALLIKN